MEVVIVPHAEGGRGIDRDRDRETRDKSQMEQDSQGSQSAPSGTFVNTNADKQTSGRTGTCMCANDGYITCFGQIWIGFEALKTLIPSPTAGTKIRV